MIIDSNKVEVNATRQEVFDFMLDMNNMLLLLPDDKISDFKSTKTDCSFKVQGGVIISLIQIGTEGNEKIIMKSGEKSPFPFTLTAYLSEMNGKSEGYIHFDGQVNMFLKMMVEKPLTHLFNNMSDRLKSHFEG